jgi:pentatricopeptide repeat protein
MRRAIATGAPRVTALSRRLLCADGSAARPEPAPVAVPHAAPAKISRSVVEALGPALSDSRRVSESASASATATAAAEFGAERRLDPPMAAEASPDDVAVGGGAEVPEGAVGASAASPLSHEEGEAGDGGGEWAGRDPRSPWPRAGVAADSADSLLESIRSSEKRTSPRRAATLYRNALERDDPTIVNKDVVWAVMPVLARLAWSVTILDTLNFLVRHDMHVPTSVLNCALGGLMRGGKSQEVRETVERMWTLPLESQPNATSYNQLIGAYFYRGQVEEAFAVLKEMKNRMMYPTWATYHMLIAGCLRRDEPRRAFETLLAVEQQRFKMSALTIGHILVMCAEADDMAALSQLIPRFEEALPLYATETKRMAERRSLHWPRGGRESTAAERSAVRGEPTLEISGIMSVLHAAYRGSRPDVGERAMAWFASWYPDMRPPLSAWYCLVGAYAASGNFPAAFDVVSRMRLAGHEPTLLDLNESLVKPLAADIAVIDEQYYRLVDALCPEEGAARRAAAKAAEEAEKPGTGAPAESGEAGEGVVEDSAPGGADGKEHLSFAESFLIRDESSLQLSPEGETAAEGREGAEVRTVGMAEINCIIAACSTVGDLDRAFHTYDEAQRLGLERNTDTFNALLLGCVTDRHFSGGVRVTEEMKKCGLPFNAETVQLLVRLCVRCGKFRQAQEWVALAVEEGVPVSSSSFQTLARKLMRLGRLADVRSLIAVAERCGMTRTAVLARVEGPFIRDLQELQGDLKEIRRDPAQHRRTARGGAGDDGGQADEGAQRAESAVKPVV